MTKPAQSFNIHSATQAERDAALMDACTQNAPLADIQALLNGGANPNTINDNKADCLLMAVLMRNDDVVRALLKHNADPHYAGFTGGKTALMWAAHMGQRQNVIALLEAGAHPEAMSDNGMNAMDWADDNNKRAVKEMIRDFIHDQKAAAVKAATDAAAKAEAAAFDAVLQQGIPLAHDMQPMKKICLKRADKLRR